MLSQVEVNPRDITVVNQYRTDLGDMEEFAKSIEELGLLHPIGITPENVLIFGQRRLVAVRDILKWPMITATVIDMGLLDGQWAENTARKDFLPSEKVAIARAMEDAGQGKEESARIVGLGSSRTLERAAEVVEHAIPDVVMAMDTGTISPTAAADISRLPEAEQKAELDRKTKPEPRKKPEKAKTIKDGEGDEVPKHLRDIFGSTRLQDMAKEIGAIRESLSRMSVAAAIRPHIRVWPWVQYKAAATEEKDILESMNCLASRITAGLPYALCPECHGDEKGCKDCLFCGYVPEWRYMEMKG